MISLKNLMASLTSAILLMSMSSGANAAIITPAYNFVYTCVSCLVKEVDWQLLSTPVISSSAASGYFDINNVKTSIGTENIYFYTPALNGGFNLDTGATVKMEAYGAQLFTGTLTSPTFVLGTYATVEQLGCSVKGTCASQLVISRAVPEPATLSLLALGLVAFTVARRKASRRDSI